MPGIVIAPRARLFHGHEWIYAGEIRKTFGDPQPGEVITLKDFRDRPLGSAIYNPHSLIVARRFSRRRQELDLDFFRRRIDRALQFRQRLALGDSPVRLVWSESDGLPGLIVDRYGNHLVVQALTLGMHQRLDLITEALVELLTPVSIILRNDSPVLKAEGLETEIRALHGSEPGAFEVTANGLIFEVDLIDGQKTGLYLDQLGSHAEVASMAKGLRVLDCFTNQGGFALACARAGAAKVTAVDISGPACEATRRNANRNGLDMEVVEHNVFDFLKHAEAEYDLIILDPPSFTRNKKSLNDAMRGYKEIHLRALKLLEKGGLLSTYCCSHHASREAFLDNLVSASVDAKKSLRLLTEHRQRGDHPILPALPETSYLKGFTVEVIPSI
ncbi:23S rRNA (cytosine1962-C5)-methyltransferase [Haloferula luteola]|uniref:23S rRNA (Cytosine1962-C5)-methyltransferase n=1 Tax=Haloferula luteola TaxID=595692 RepID=A0A840VED0_9BACT|nr:class I SAM-dependent rRNA methyltransferase [Haloferula luteola]MBB5352220.1 23S rRNA (cytosine1962-C5)-methyltransferase [Haloferula luteola]